MPNDFSGMTNANMQLVVLNVDLEDKLETPVPKLEIGEYIVTKVVELSRLKAELEGTVTLRSSISIIFLINSCQNTTKRYTCCCYNSVILSISQGFVVDARLFHFASGLALTQQVDIT